MKTASYFIIAFIFGAFIFIEIPNYRKPKVLSIPVDNGSIIQEKKEFYDWSCKIQKQHKEIEAVLDSLN